MKGTGECGSSDVGFVEIVRDFERGNFRGGGQGREKIQDFRV